MPNLEKPAKKPRAKAKNHGHRIYTEADKASALALLKANKGDMKRTVRELGIPYYTLHGWNKGNGVNKAVHAKLAGQTEELSDLFEKVARAYIDRALSDDAVAGSKGRDAVIAAATAVDKMRLLRDQPTSITCQGLTDDERLDRLGKLLERVRARRLGRDDGGGAEGVRQLEFAPADIVEAVPAQPSRNGVQQPG